MTSHLSAVVSFLCEAKRFTTPGKRGSAKVDKVGIVVSKFVNAMPEIARSIEDREQKRYGIILRGAWPTTGRKILDWEIDAWGESGGDVMFKMSMWSREGGEEGQVWRINIADVDRTIPKFLRKFLIPTIMSMKAKGKKVKK